MVGLGSLGNKRGALSNQDIPVHQIIGGITHESIVVKRLWKQVGRIDHGTARGGDVSARHQLRRRKPLRIGSLLPPASSLHSLRLCKTMGVVSAFSADRIVPPLLPAHP